MRARMESHRRSPSCAACHRIMDPIGLALENFDAVGAWRTRDGGTPIDASGQSHGRHRGGRPVSLRRALAAKQDVFVGNVAEKLLTYALGRRLEYDDMPAVRTIVRDAARDEPLLVTHPGRGQRASRFAWPASRPTRAEGLFNDVHHQTIASTADVPARCRRRHWRCRCSMRWCRRSPRSRATAAHAPPWVRLRAARRDPESVDAGDERTPLSELTPILKPLEPFRDSLTIVSNLARPEERAQDHACTGAWLTGVRAEANGRRRFPRRQEHRSDRRRADRQGDDVPVARGGDRGLHRHAGRVHSRIQLRLHEHAELATPTTPLPMETNPRAVFERMFGWETTREQRLARMKSDQSVLDLITEDLGDLEQRLGGRDRARVDEYVELRARDRTPDSALREADGKAAGRSGRAGRDSGVVRGARRHAVRPAGPRLRGRPHARVHVHDEPRVQPADLSGPWRHRAAPRRFAQ